MKRHIHVGTCVAALVLGSIAVAAPASADCPSGTVPTRYPGVCTAGQSRGGPPQVINPGDVTTNIQPNQIPTMNGVPCNINHFGTCWGFAQNP
ncbi:hypothetical protein [Mycobacterium sp. M26]|uniref:hypothetical protein n=1 Tax=Mycobacterium sp. M26 TaxID=1762962 RepID=UPI00073E25FF|nr:hypothetical protein [Mycobacterium sp. M26]